MPIFRLDAGRKIRGETYHASHMIHKTKATAEAEAKSRRRRNQKARVVKITVYKVYFREKRARRARG